MATNIPANAPKPQDHKAPVAKTFTFTHNGNDYTIPSIAALPVGVTRRARKAADEGDAVFIMLETVLAEDSPELVAIDSMDGEQFNDFLLAWGGGAPMGESSDS